jgi:hypothetical protein
MDTKFRFLDQLERDLHDAAVRERALKAAPASGRPMKRPSSKGGMGSWGTIAAGFVILLVVAGAIGGLAQLGRNSEQSTSADAGASPGSYENTGKAGSGGSDSEQFVPAAVPSPAPAGLDDSYRNLSEEDRLTLQWSALEGAQYSAEASRTRPNSQPSLHQDLSKVIRDGSITVVVPADSFGDRFDQATVIAAEAGGFVLASSISQENQGTLTLRIPSKRLDGAVVKLRSLGRLAELNLSGRDVTADYIDMKARLSVLQTQRELIVKLLHAATTVDGQLGLSNRFADVQTQIEQIQGSLNVLNDRVELATLKVTLREEGVAAPATDDEVGHATLGSAWDRAVQGFFGVVAAVVVGLGYLIPLLVLAGAVLLVRRAVIRRRAAS